MSLNSMDLTPGLDSGKNEDQTCSGRAQIRGTRASESPKWCRKAASMRGESRVSKAWMMGGKQGEEPPVHVKAIIPRNFKPGFRLDLMAKDVGLSMDYARQNRIVLPVMSLIQQVYLSMLNQGHAEDAYSVVSQWTQQQNQEE
jgi:hypothetical protein